MPSTYTVETETITLPNVTKTGYTFDGWFTDSDFTTQVTEIALGSTGDLVLYAKFTVSTYVVTFDTEFECVVTFDSNGGTEVETQTLSIGDSLVVPAEPTKTGYIFRGWFTDEECTEYYNFTGDITSSLTLYAGWEDKTGFYYYVSMSSPVKLVPSEHSTKNDSYYLSLSGTNTGYRKTFYFIATEDGEFNVAFANRTSSYNSGYTYCVVNETQNRSCGSQTLTGTGASYYAPSGDCSAKAGDLISIYLWNYKSGYSAPVDIYFYGATATTPNAKVPSSVTVTYGEEFTLPFQANEGYTFKGYYTEANGEGTQLTDSTGASITAWTITSDTKVYAYYEAE